MRATAVVCGGFSALVGLGVLIGWALDIPVLQSLLPGFVSMKPNTAVALVLSGAALVLLTPSPVFWPRRVAGRACALLVLALAGVILCELLFGWQTGLDELLFQDTAGTPRTVAPGRMALPTAVGFILVALGLLGLEWEPRRGFRPADWLAILVVLLGVASAMQHGLTTPDFDWHHGVTPMALHTTMAFMALGAGILLARPGRGVLGTLRGGAVSGLEQRIHLTLALSTFLLVVAGMATLFSVHDAESRARRVDQINHVRRQLLAVLSCLQDIQTGERGYALTGISSFLEPYNRAQAEMATNLERLGALVADSAGQSERFRQLEVLVSDKIEFVRGVVNARDLGDAEQALGLVSTGQGKELMDGIRDLIAAMDGEELRLLEERRVLEQSGTRRLNLAVTIGGVLMAGTLLLAIIGIRRGFKVGGEAQEALRASEESLAITLRSIGDGVLTTDTGGLVTGLNPVAEQLTGWTQADAQGQPVASVFHIVHEATRRPVEIPVDKVLATGQIQGLANHTVLIARDGHERPIADSAAPLHDMQGKLRGVVLVFRDVTAERAAAAERDRFFTLSLDLLCIAHLDGYFKRVNLAFTNTLGWSTEELLARPFLEFVHPDDKSATIRVVEEQLAVGSELLNFENRYQHKDGSWRVLSWKTVPQPDGFLFATARDVSASRAAERALRESEELLRCVLDSMQANIAVLDREGTIVAINRAWRQFALESGTAPSLQGMAVGANYLAVCEGATRSLGEEAAAVLGGLQGVLSHTQETFTHTYACPSPTRQCWFVMRASPLLREGGGAVIAHTDITEQEQAKQRLKDFKAALDEHCIVAITDWHGFITYVNDKFCAISKYARDELVGQDHVLVNSGYHSRSYIRDLWQTIQNGRVWKGEFRNRAKDGTFHWLDTTIVPFLDDQGKPDQYIAIRTDITASKESAAELEHARTLAEAANKAKSAFLATMSHEIRTPMNGVIGTVDVLRQTSLRSYQVELVDIIRESACGLLEVIDDILDFSKIEAGKIEIERESLSLAEMVETVCQVLNPVAVRKHVDFTYFTDPRLPERILCDSLRLRQILNNLVANAIKFSARLERPGRVRVRVEWNDVESIRISVADNGIGMTPEVLNKLFQPFTQGDSSTTRSFGGTGLGLSICKELVKLLGGTISAESTPDQGSIFTVVLPVQVVEHPEDRPTPCDLTDLPCVVVHPDAETAADWRAYLQHEGARVTTATALTTAAPPAAVSLAPPCVVIVSEARLPLDLEALRAPFAAWPGTVRHVLVTRGYHRRPHQEAEDVAVVDGDTMRRRNFLYAVGLAAGRLDPLAEEIWEGSDPANLPLSVEEAAARGRLILVAEDNEINQKVIGHQLTMLGFACEIAKNGTEALERWRSGRFAMLLSDLHMPVMDGYALAKAIRAEEGPSRHMPIIAFTADITKGERERCREAGMDDYLSKPTQLEVFRAMLDKWLAAAQAHHAPSKAGSGKEPPLAVLDTTALTELIGPDPEVAAEFLEDFLDSAQATAAELREAVAESEWKLAGALGHRLKSSARAVGALALGECCARLETMGAAGDGAGIEGFMPTFEESLTETIRAIGQQRSD